ncbi:MAG: hypothetical protein SFU91_15015 [Chloroherpetonaceae bacterium]|nr:hypothetical protein [Chloroherpetonaceae bacterium]
MSSVFNGIVLDSALRQAQCGAGSTVTMLGFSDSGQVGMTRWFYIRYRTSRYACTSQSK